MNLQNRKRFTDLENPLMAARCRVGNDAGKGVWDGHVPLLYLK